MYASVRVRVNTQIAIDVHASTFVPEKREETDSIQPAPQYIRVVFFKTVSPPQPRCATAARRHCRSHWDSSIHPLWRHLRPQLPIPMSIRSESAKAWDKEAKVRLPWATLWRTLSGLFWKAVLWGGLSPWHSIGVKTWHFKGKINHLWLITCDQLLWLQYGPAVADCCDSKKCSSMWAVFKNRSDVPLYWLVGTFTMASYIPRING